MTFRAADERAKLAPWTGTLFAIGHSLSVAIVAVGVSLVAGLFSLPPWFAAVIDWAIVLLLLLVGTLNLRALVAPQPYKPVGWRQGLVPRSLRDTSHPLAIVVVGMIFGLVFDTATQAAAWGTAASMGGGAWGALAVAGVFAAGMILTDTLDSQIVARLLRANGDPARATRYRRVVGWLIVGLSYAMAAYALAGLAGVAPEMSETLFTGLGVSMATAVVLLLGAGWLKRGKATKLIDLA